MLVSDTQLRKKPKAELEAMLESIDLESLQNRLYKTELWCPDGDNVIIRTGETIPRVKWEKQRLKDLNALHKLEREKSKIIDALIAKEFEQYYKV